jgi:hypothetical protein
VSSKIKLDIHEFNGTYEIVPAGGQTKFEEPPFPMLPSLLKNPKVAKDGSLYKVIPIGKSDGGNKPKTIMNAIREQNQSRQRMRDAMDNKSGKIRRSSSGQEYRTASSKQDPSTQWVKPGKTVDIEEDVKELNNYLEHRVNGIIYEELSKAERSIS